MSVKKFPIIGVTGNLVIEETPSIQGGLRTGLYYDYITSISDAGGIPMILPPLTGEEAITKQIEAIDGLVLSGGQDVNPILYGEEPSQLLGAISEARDEYEMRVIKIAYSLKKPILGICRGMQILNVAFGGTLYQDVSLAAADHLNHWQKAEKHVGTHSVEIVQPSLLFDLFGKRSLLTNSFHHQSVKQLASGFIKNAVAKDGIIEGIELQGGSFVLGVQWHPERMASANPDMSNLFKTFVAAVKG